MLNAPALPSNSATMSSMALVDFINVERSSTDKVLRHDHFLDKVLLVLGLDAPKFRGIYIDSMNRERPCYYFRKREACLMAMSYSYELQARVFDYMTKLEENETKPVANLSDASTLRELLLGYTEQVIQLQATVEAQKPAVAFHECVKASINSQSIEDVAKALGTGRNRMYQFLRQQGLLKMDNSPYQEYIDRDYFEVELRTYKDKNFKDVIYPMTMVTGRGVDYIYRKFF